MAKKYQIKCERYITDFRGREIGPGNIVAVSRSGPGSRDLEMQMVSSISESAITYCGVVEDAIWVRQGAKYKKISKGFNLEFSHRRSRLFKEVLQPHLVVIDNPLFALENPKMENMLRALDAMKDAGHFSAETKLGESVLGFEDSDE